MNLQPILHCLPSEIRQAVKALPPIALEEIHLRVSRPPTIISGGSERTLLIRSGFGLVTAGDLDLVVNAASGHSVYAVNEFLRNGFLTLEGGHRIGLCGHAVVRDGQVTGMKELAALTIRVARPIHLDCTPVMRSTLIVGAPGSGKTTLLRNQVRTLSDKQGFRVSLIDERFEIAACREGAPQLDVGRRTDVLSGCPKAEGMMLMLRSMNPEWIAVDEITTREDLSAMAQVSYCGVQLLATAHARSREDLVRRPLYRRLMSLGIFSQLLVLDTHRNVTQERFEVHAEGNGDTSDRRMSGLYGDRDGIGGKAGAFPLSGIAVCAHANEK